MSSVPMPSSDEAFRKYLGLVSAVDIDVEEVMDCLIEWYCRHIGEERLKEMHAGLVNELGRIHPEDDVFENRTRYVLNLLLFSQASAPGMHASPYEVFSRELMRSGAVLADSARGHAGGSLFFEPFHSIYAVKKSRSGQVNLLDLFSRGTIKVTLMPERKEHLAFPEKSVVQTFILKLGQNFHFTQGCIFHPPGTLKMIRGFIAAKAGKNTLAGNDKTDVLKKLAAAQLSHYRLSHVRPEMIYGQRLPL